MPLAITIETAYGPVGVGHAGAPHCSWAESLRRLKTPFPSVVDDVVLGFASVEASRRHQSRTVVGLRALVLGHQPVPHVECVANCWNIDTGAGIPHLNRLSLGEVNITGVSHTRTFDTEDTDESSRAEPRPRVASPAGADAHRRRGAALGLSSAVWPRDAQCPPHQG